MIHLLLIQLLVKQFIFYFIFNRYVYDFLPRIIVNKVWSYDSVFILPDEDYSIFYYLRVIQLISSDIQNYYIGCLLMQILPL